MEKKDLADILHKVIDSNHKQSDIIYKKIFVLISMCAGVSTVFFKIKLNESWSISLGVVLTFAVIGIFVNYIRLSKLYKDSEELKSKLKELKDG